MRITYDPEVDILLVTLAEDQAAASEEIVPGVVVDYDAHQAPITLEVQHASERYPKDVLARLDLDQPLSLAELGREYGLVEAHLRKLANSGRLALAARKIGRNWTATRADLEAYLESRKYNAKQTRLSRAG